MTSSSRHSGLATLVNLEKWEWLAVIAIVTVMLIYSQVLMAWRVNNFLTFYPADTGEGVQALWNCFEGRPFQQTISGEGYNELSAHGCFSLALLLPILRLFPHGLTLCLVKNLLVVFTAIPIYMIIRRLFDDAALRILVFLSFCTSGFLRVNLNLEIHAALFALPFLALAWHDYMAGNFRRFMACCLVCVMTKENFTFLFIMSGMVAAMDRRALKWILGPILVATIYFTSYRLLNHYWFMPESMTQLNLFKKLYGSWGDSFWTCLAGMLANPVQVMKCLFNPSKWFLLSYAAFPYLPFLILRPRLLLLASPCLGIVFLMTGRGDDIFHPGMLDYYCEASLLASIAFIETLAAWNKQRPLSRPVVLTFAVAAIFLSWCLLDSAVLSKYMLVNNGLEAESKLVAFVLASCLGLVGLTVLLRFASRLGMAMAGLVLVQNIFFHSVILSRSMFNSESLCFKIPDHAKKRNQMARAALSVIPREASLAVPAKYAIVAAARPRLYIYNSTEPLKSKFYFNENTPRYVFIDRVSYHTIFDSEHFNKTWDRSNITALLEDKNHWNLIFFFEGLYLLKDIQNKDPNCRHIDRDTLKTTPAASGGDLPQFEVYHNHKIRMHRYEITYLSTNTGDAPKPITAMVCEPTRIGPNTGAMLFTHGWGGSRYNDLDKIDEACERYDLACISVEFRQSGLDHDPHRGRGWDCPYDLSFYQLFDVLNGLREVLALRPGLSTRRLFHYGGSQGGHVALLGAIVAPNTFAAVYASCAPTFIEPHFLVWAGREFFPHELSCRNVLEHAGRIRCPVYLDHGTDDKDVPCEHSRKLEAILRKQGTPVESAYYAGAGHMLEPISSRAAAFRAMAPRFLPSQTNPETPEILSGGKVMLPCDNRTLTIDWSQPTSSADLMSWTPRIP